MFLPLSLFPRAKGPQGDPKQGDAQGAKPSLEFESLADLGAHLRAEREKAGLSRSEIANRTKITLDQLSNIESGTFTGLAPVYAKGFLKSYAQTVGLDPADIVREYKRHTGELGTNPYKPLTSKYRESDIVSEDGWGAGSIVALLLAIVVAAILLVTFNSGARDFASRYIGFLKPPSEAADDGAVAKPKEPQAAQAPSKAQAPAQAQAQAPAQAAAGQGPAKPAQAQAQAQAQPQAQAQAQAPAPDGGARTGSTLASPARGGSSQTGTLTAQDGQGATQATLAPQAPREGGSLTLTALAATWAQLTVDNGPLQHVYFREGESRSFDSSKGVTVTAGNGKALRAVWNGVVYQQLGPEGPTERAFPPS